MSETRARRSLPRFQASHLALMSAAALLFMFCESKELAMNDLAIYLAQGREMAELGGLADVDRYTHTVEGMKFLNGTWGSQVVFWALWKMGSVDALQMLLATAVCSTILIVAWGARRASGNPNALGLGGMLCAWLVVQNLGLRPQLFSLPLFAGYAAIALSVRPTWKTMLASAAIVAVWTNLHGSFILAPILSGGIAVGLFWEDRKQLPEAIGHLITSAIAFAAALLNPYGLAIYRYVAENSRSPAGRGLTEWAPTSIAEPAGIRMAVAAAILALVFALHRRLPARRDLPALLAFTFLALTAIRHVVWLGMLVPIMATRVFPPKEEAADAPAPATNPEGLHPVFGFGAVIFWLAAVLYQMPVLRPDARTGDALIEARFNSSTPVRLAAWAADNGVKGKLFNSMEWGGYFAYRLPPDAKLFVDVRIWIYPQEIWDDMLRISEAEHGWEDILDRHEVEFAILDRRFHHKLLPYMTASDRWEQIYSDDLGLIFKRRR